MASLLIYGCMGLGITRFDHADIYGRGKSEAVFGELLQRDAGLRDRIQLQSKVGIRLGAPADSGTTTSARQRSWTAWPGPSAGCARTTSTCSSCTAPIPCSTPPRWAPRSPACSPTARSAPSASRNMSPAQMTALQDHLHVPLAADQLELSLYHHGFVDSAVLVNHPDGAATSFPHGTLEHCLRHGIEVQAWSPLAGGRYTGRTAAHAGPHDGAAAALVAELAAAKGTTGQAVVLGWLLRHPARIAPVIGSATPQRIAACADAEAVAGSMTREEWFTLHQTARGRSIP